MRRIALGVEGGDDSLWPVGFCGLLAERLGAEVTETTRLPEGRWTAPLHR